MSVSSFVCPHCNTLLRIRDKVFIGKEIGCPQCSGMVLVNVDDAGELMGVAPDPAMVPVKTRPVMPRVSTRAISREWMRFVQNPVAVAWVVAAAITLAILAAIVPWSDSDTQAAQPDPPQQKSNDPSPDTAIVVPVAVDAKAQLERLSQLVAAYSARHGHLPAASVAAGDLDPDKRFSWLALLASDQRLASFAPPVWNRPWNDPANDRFVRQRVSQFQNPQVPRAVSADNYPATTYVGVGGLGVDGPMLPANHVRAGIFGHNRRTQRQDIKDGESQTMMLAGVTAHLGSWAAGGNATVRPFAQEPYVNGPDGFGTGESDGMSVAMADGSVRFLSKDTDPAVVRQLAAMADGFPPSSEQINEAPAIPVADAPAESEQPRVPEPEPVDAPRPPPQRAASVIAFEQRIREYAPSRPVAFRELLMEMEELAGVPIRLSEDIDPATDPLMDSEIRLERQTDTTVGALVQSFAEAAGLTYTIERDGVTLHRP